MSFQILYATRFITVGENVLPLILTGSSNTYSTSGLRARDWYVPKYLTSDYPFTTPDHIITSLKEEREKLIAHNRDWLTKYPDWSEYSDAQFGWYASLALDPLETSQTSLDTVLGFYEEAFKNARPIEEIPPLIFQPGYQIEEDCRRNNIPVPLHQYVRDTLSLIAAITQWKEKWQDRFVVMGVK